MPKSSENENLVTVKAAFCEILEIRGIYKKIGINRFRVSHLRKDALYGEFPSHEYMLGILEKAGYVKVQEELWTKLDKEK